MSTYGSENWVNVQDELSGDEMNEILELVNEKENYNGEPLSYNGNYYRVNMDGKYAIEMLKGGAGRPAPSSSRSSMVDSYTETISDVKKATKLDYTLKKEPEKPRRTTKEMAYMKDASNLTEFVQGCFYEIKQKKVDGDYTIILTDNKKERVVKTKRLTFVNVFTEAPIEDAATSAGD